VAFDGRLYLDTNTIISMVEFHGSLTAGQKAFVEAMDAGALEAVSSEIALSECLVMPLRERDGAALEAILTFLDGRSILPLVTADRGVMIEAAKIRAARSMKLPDAIHLACASFAECTIVVSADRRLTPPAPMHRISFDEIDALMSGPS
jgi:predicted nucleic acid-binding protein